MLERSLTLDDAFIGFSDIYRRANAYTTMGGRGERFAFLGLACGDLSRCVRKKQTHLYPIAVAQLFAWFASLSEELFRGDEGVILSRGMMMKYPKKCGYCHQLPCVCIETKRAEHTAEDFTELQMMWSINTWQEHLHALYGKANQEGGIPRALNRLFEEVSEVGLILYLADGANEDLETLEQKAGRELADVLAWLFAFCSLAGISLEEAICKLYKAGCPVCKAEPCACKNFTKQPSGALTHRFMSASEIFKCVPL